MTSKETKRQRVFVQVQSKFTGKWSNTKSAPTYPDAACKDGWHHSLVRIPVGERKDEA